jgi:hypothetical protein
MRAISFWKWWKPMIQKNRWPGFLASILFLYLGAPFSFGGPPDWLQMAARQILPPYPDALAVMLRNEQIVTISNTAEVTTIYRCAYRILRPEGRRYGIVQIPFDSETRILSIKGWSIPATGTVYEVGEKDALDTILFNENLYEDTRQKVLKIPASEPGAVIGYEYKQRRRSFILQDQWVFQQDIPVRLARFEIHIPAEWSYQEFWLNHPIVAVEKAGPHQYVWELKEIPEIKTEPAMPFWQTTAGQLFLRYIPPNREGSFGSWDEVCQWYTQLVSGRRQATVELRQKAMELIAGAPDNLAKIRALASFVQREIRYVAIEIGLGGYQPNSAGDILKNSYGDCKDKVTLLSTMLHEIGVESYYVLVNTHRGMVRSEFPSPLFFNHVVLAISMPTDIPVTGFYSSMGHPQMGSLLFFDPTYPHLMFGYLPSELQASKGLLVSTSGGGLIVLPSSPASANSRQRTARVNLAKNGDLLGKVEESYTGVPAADFRSAWLNSSKADHRKVVQALFGKQTTGVEVHDISVRGLREAEGNPVMNYSFRLRGYASTLGKLVLLQPRILSKWSRNFIENGERQQPVEFSSAMAQTETIEINLPDGYVVDEFPSPVSADMGALSYDSKIEVNGTLLRYSRRIEIKDVRVPTEQLAELKKFYRQVALDEKAMVILKRNK